MTQDIDIPTWKWEVINMDFITWLPRTRRQHESIWVIVDRVTESSHFLAVKTTNSAEDYAKLYINEIMRLHGVHLSIISDRASVVPLESVAVKDSLSYKDVPAEILDRQVRRLRNKEVALVNVWWRSQSVEGASWEAEAAMKAKYPHLFPSDSTPA
ncbi:hypothetical protein MTR67_002399 [Solanum verrucosum]|uniref:Uncharacterized protein n=1 Tax=Solanum verrucosum TaxID=315347 RepID=A0AAF0PQ19_SOLVR|nr:hypothetical protein MTR67_002399 [Solanum verrucosum]